MVSMTIEELVDDWVEGRRKQRLADELGCSLVTFNKKVRGESPWFLSEAVKLSHMLGVTLEEFVQMSGSAR